MIVASIDLGGDATRAAAEGQAALAVGETVRAREHFEVAGDILETKIGSLRKQSDKHLTRFLAASQFYHRGHYQKAVKLARRVEAKFLSPEARPLFDKFFRDANERADPGYEAKVRRWLLGHWQKKEYGLILTLLQDHPYVLPQAELAFFRAVCFENLRDWHAAAVFFADALKGDPDDPGKIFTSASYPLSLAGSGDLAEAWKYVEYQLKEMPHAVTFITASLIRFHQANLTTHEEERRALLAEQIRYYQEAWERYQQLPAKIGNHPDAKEYMVLCFETAAFALDRAGDKVRAREVCDVAISFAPNAYGLKTVRGISTYPSDQALVDFRHAIHLGEPNYYPYYFLAHASIVSGNFADAQTWCQETLRQRPSRRIKAQLNYWLAVARQQLGSANDEVNILLQRALELDPDNPAYRRNVDTIKASMTILPFDADGLNAISVDSPFYMNYVAEHESIVLNRRGQTDAVERELVGVGA